MRFPFGVAALFLIGAGSCGDPASPAPKPIGARELATRGPVWMFAAKNRPPSEGGTTQYQQTVDDVADMAKIWLRAE